MILYNITVKIDHAVHDDWLAWMRTKHIPDVLETGLFSHCRLAKILEQNEQDGATYSVQYTCSSMNDYFTYQREHAAALQVEHTERYKNKFVAFRTLLRTVDELEVRL
jgi:hypothetical protein